MTHGVGLGDMQQAPLTQIAEATRPIPVSTRRTTLRRILRQRSAIVGLALILFLIAIAIFAPVLSHYGPNDVLIGVEAGAKPRQPPCIHLLGCPSDQPEHFFGLDSNVRDVYSRILFGSRISLTVGFAVVLGSIGIGMIIGAISGYVAGNTDNVMMRMMDMLLAFPALLLAIVIVTILGRNLTNAMIAIGIVAVPVYARVMRSAVLSVRESDYVTASKALGESQIGILRRRVVPNSVTPLIVQGTLGIGTAVLEIAALSFLGLAAQPPDPEWGAMIGAERNQILAAPWLTIIPGIMLTLTVLGFNLLGDGLRDAFDPRLTH